MEEKFSISVKLDLDDFLRYHRHVLFGGFRGKIAAFFLGMIALSFIANLFTIEDPLILLTNSLIPAFVIGFIYFIVYHRVVKSFNSDTRLHGTFTYEMDRKWLIVKGENFQTKTTWDKIYKVLELKPFFLIYQNKYSASIIPKSDLTIGEVKNFRAFINTIPDLKKKLRNK